jgi:hypothetical protein
MGAFRAVLRLTEVHMEIAIKAVGDWELEVLGVPYGGPTNGRDADGEYFSQKTDLYLEQFSSPLITYYHGYTPDGKPQGRPEIIGKAVSYEKRADGVWWRVALDRTKELARIFRVTLSPGTHRSGRRDHPLAGGGNQPFGRGREAPALQSVCRGFTRHESALRIRRGDPA